MFVDVYFDTSAVPHGLVPWMPLLAGVIAQPRLVASASLADALERRVARLGCRATAICSRSTMSSFRPTLVMEIGLLSREVPRALPLLAEFLAGVRSVDGDALARLLPIALAEAAERIRSAAPVVALDRAGSRFSPFHRYLDLTGGVDRYLFLIALRERWATYRDRARAAVAAASDLALGRGRLTVSVTADEREFARHAASVFDLVGRLPLRASRARPRGLANERPRDESIPVGRGASAAAIAADLGRDGRAFSGEMSVLCAALNTGYVWDEIRQRGGAYAAFVSVERSGLLGCFTAGDPHPARSLAAFRRAGRAIRGFTATPSEMSGLVRGTLGRLEAWDDPPESSRRAMRALLAGETPRARARARREIEATTPARVRALATLWDEAMERASSCVLTPL